MAETSARLLVALDAAEDTLAMLEGFARLAAGLQRELVGLLVDDPGAAYAAALPFTRLVSRGAPTEGVFDLATTRRAMRVFARRLEERLAETCGRYQVRWSFRIMQGGLAAAGLAEGDILVFGPRGPAAGEGAPAAPCPMVLMRSRGRTVVVLYEGGGETVRLGRAIADRERLRLVVLALSGEAPRATAGEVAEIEILDAVDDETLRQRIAAARPRTVVLDACGASVRWPAAVAGLAMAGSGAARGG
jgi:hypothetical protein